MQTMTIPYSSTPNTIQTNFTVKDPYSALTHFIGIIYSAILSPLILGQAFIKQADSISTLAVSVFMISMILLFSASTIYHTFYINEKVSMLLKKFDHSMIFMLIAGTYTPVCLIPLRAAGGLKLLAFVWGVAILGIIFKLCWVTCPKWISSVIYIGLGWSCIFSLPALYEALPLASFIWLVVGGIFYTVGGVIYALKLKAFNTKNPNFGSHEVFHVFVMLGSLAHFLCVWQSL